jgi:inner membrane protein
MQAALSRLRRSASLKVVSIGFLVLVLLIPLGMIEGVILDRGAVGQEARSDIMSTWGGTQLVGGPVLIVPYDRLRPVNSNDEVVEPSRAYALPTNLKIEAQVDTDVRYRGMHKVPVYSAELRISGTISRPDIRGLDSRSAGIRWGDAVLAVAVTDARAITATPGLSIAGTTVQFRPGHAAIGNLAAPIVAPVGTILGTATETMAFEFTLALNGTEDLEFLPLGDSTRANLQADWPAPSFVGNYLPETREIGAAGFDAAYRISNIGRALPSQWTQQDDVGGRVSESAFGVRLYTPVSLYQLTLRAAKYGVLFVGLTFVAYFLFETVAKLRLHPLQYLLVGLANSLFFLLLLSLAEHIGFGKAYLASSTGSGALIVSYSYTVLGSRLRAAVMAAILACLYAFLYLTLNAENFALLAGSVGLWVGLAVTMYLTRRIDWYGAAGEDS